MKLIYIENKNISTGVYQRMEVIKIKRDYIIPILVGLILIAVVGYWGYNQYQSRQRVETYLGNKYQQSFYEMVESVEQIQVLLGKTTVAATPGQNILNLTEIWRNCDVAQSELNKLPLAESSLYDTAKFLNQTGDLCHVLARKNARGNGLSQKDKDQLDKLKENTVKLTAALHDLESKVFKGKMNWVELVRGTKQKIQENGDNFLANGFNDIQKDMTKYPTLIYDGPFSDHITEAKPKGLKGDTITLNTAKKKAKNAIRQIIGDNLQSSDGQSIKGKLEGYTFDISKEGSPKYSIDISKKGGYVVNLLTTRDVPSSKLSTKQAVQKAQEYLAVLGYLNMEATFSEVKGNIGYISFAYQPDEIIYYPDIIDVQVALDNGQVLAVEALSYLMTHRKREPVKPKLSEKRAKGLIQDKFENIENVQLAVIPKDNNEEVLCYEFRGKRAEEVYLIYVNASSGAEEQILKLVKHSNGTFAI